MKSGRNKSKPIYQIVGQPDPKVPTVVQQMNQMMQQQYGQQSGVQQQSVQQQAFQQQTQVYPRTQEENNLVLMKIMTAEQFRVKCRHCQSILFSTNSTELKKCKCGKVGIDGGKAKNSRRLTGSLDDVDVA